MEERQFYRSRGLWVHYQACVQCSSDAGESLRGQGFPDRISIVKSLAFARLPFSSNEFGGSGTYNISDVSPGSS